MIKRYLTGLLGIAGKVIIEIVTNEQLKVSTVYTTP